MQEIIELKEMMEYSINKKCVLQIGINDMKIYVNALTNVITKYPSHFELLKMVCTMLKYHYPPDTIRLLIQDMIINNVRINFGELTVSNGEIAQIIRLNFSLRTYTGTVLDKLMEEIESTSPNDVNIDELSYLMVRNINAMLWERA